MEKLVIGILAHVDAGKTTLSEGILYLTGKIRKLGRVDHKEMEETVHGSYSWCRLTKRETY